MTRSTPFKHDVSEGVPRLGELVQVVLGKALPNPLYLVTKVVTRIPAPVSVVVFLRRAPFGTEV